MAEINVTDLTTKALNGTGAFDELMQAVSVNLIEEYSKNRIKGADYSTVYLGAMTAVMQQALSFILERQTSDKQAELLDSQKKLADKQIEGSELDNQLKTKQLIKMDSEIYLLQQQELNLAKELEKITAEIALINQNTANAAIQASSLTKQQAKIEAETALLSQKKFTEQAQILDTVNGIAVTGVVGKQKALYAKQTDGFDRDAEQKLVKIFADTWNVRRSTNDKEGVAGTGLEDPNIQTAVSKAIVGIDATFTVVPPPPS